MNAPRDRRRAARGGFTLIEVVVVVVIIAIVGSAAAGVSFTGGPTRRAAEAALAVRADIEYARALAVESASQVAVRFPLDPPSLYRVETAAGVVADPRTGRPFVIDLRALTGREAFIELRDFGGATDLLIGVDGAPVAGGSIIISVAGARYRISVAPVTGGVTVTEL